MDGWKYILYMSTSFTESSYSKTDLPMFFVNSQASRYCKLKQGNRKVLVVL